MLSCRYRLFWVTASKAASRFVQLARILHNLVVSGIPSIDSQNLSQFFLFALVTGTFFSFSGFLDEGPSSTGGSCSWFYSRHDGSHSCAPVALDSTKGYSGVLSSVGISSNSCLLELSTDNVHKVPFRSLGFLGKTLETLVDKSSRNNFQAVLF